MLSVLLNKERNYNSTAEIDECRNNSIKRMRDHEHERHAAETSEQREDRLQSTRGQCQEQCAAETSEQEWLQRMRYQEHE